MVQLASWLVFSSRAAFDARLSWLMCDDYILLRFSHFEHEKNFCALDVFVSCCLAVARFRDVLCQAVLFGGVP